MKLVKEHIVFEKFIQDSDPIHDLGIGRRKFIENWLKKYNITDYIINDDLTIDVHRTVLLGARELHNFPDYIQFNEVTMDFSIQKNYFTSLKGCPKVVKGIFSCSNNLLRSLKYAPARVDGWFCCHHNRKKFTKADVLRYTAIKDNQHIALE